MKIRTQILAMVLAILLVVGFVSGEQDRIDKRELIEDSCINLSIKSIDNKLNHSELEYFLKNDCNEYILADHVVDVE